MKTLEINGMNIKLIILLMQQKKISNYVKLINPNMKISACTYMSSYDAKNVYCQDVNEWIKNKYIDLLCPMIYTLDNNYFLECINDYKKNM